MHGTALLIISNINWSVCQVQASSVLVPSVPGTRAVNPFKRRRRGRGVHATPLIQSSRVGGHAWPEAGGCQLDARGRRWMEGVRIGRSYADSRCRGIKVIYTFSWSRVINALGQFHNYSHTEWQLFFKLRFPLPTLPCASFTIRGRWSSSRVPTARAHGSVAILPRPRGHGP